MRPRLRLTLALFCLWPAFLAAGEAQMWGKADGELQISLAMASEVTAGGAFEVRLSIKTADVDSVTLPALDTVFAWLFIAQDSDDGKKGCFTEKLKLEPAQEWPKQLPPEKPLEFKPKDVAGATVYPFHKGQKTVRGYPVIDAPDDKVEPAGKLAAVLTAGKASLRMMFCIPRGNDRPLLLTSNIVQLQVLSPDAAQFSPAVAALLKDFDRDAFGGKTAHASAVKLGAAIVPELVRAVKVQKRPEYSRLWIATAIADIVSANSVAALTELLDDPLPTVRAVVGYHGPKQNNEKLDKLIVSKAATSRDGNFVAYALLGFLVFRNSVPADLLKAGLESDDPKARNTAVSALTNSANDFNIQRLRALANDKDQRVRATAQKVLAIMEKARQEK
ncbi:MAG: hypothetical protein NTW87_27870 [Planctomycetota bacterium]|nr:hypothetical protein [Planctomycetota bacterium]